MVSHELLAPGRATMKLRKKWWIVSGNRFFPELENDKAQIGLLSASTEMTEHLQLAVTIKISVNSAGYF